MKTPRIFLGGTCNGSLWRDKLIPKIEKTFYNPVVPDWTPEQQQIEKDNRQNCEKCLYVITPKMTGVYSIAEVVDDSNKRPEKTVFYILEEDSDERFTAHQLKALHAVGKLVESNGAYWAKSEEELLSELNS